MSDSFQSVEFVPRTCARELYTKSGAEQFGLTEAQFCSVLAEVARKYLPTGATAGEIQTFCLNLRVEELALARACACGHEYAWELFLTRYREKLYQMALQIAREDSAARDLADSMYGDLYGVQSGGAQRVSKLASYTGRGSLEGWLRTVLAQEHVNRYRRQKRLVSLEEENEEGVQFAAATAEADASVDTRVEIATDEALEQLQPEERLILAFYYLDGRTLAEIARVLGVHESTISRKLDKVAKSLRKKIMAGLGRQGMSRRQAQEALEVDVRDLRVNIRKHLSQERVGQSFPEKQSVAQKKVEAGAGEGTG
ncbi:MAG TPA: sigma-70 family RNA polymerase sigma factor [Terriglobales bacterium]|nr:sigma-70 family RNA polymerase sigma factor [Terriglobales bacterium]